MAVDIVINETIDVVDITVNPNIIEVNVTRTSGGGGSQTLAQTLDLGNTTGGENILVNNADAIELENTSLLQKGTYNFGGNGGISRICSNNYEDMWQNGFRHVFDQSGFIRNSSNGFDLVPDSSFDVTLRFKVGSFWSLDNGTTYICTDATEGAAEWELYSVGATPTLQEVTDEGATTTNDITVSKETGTSYIRVENGDDTLTLQVDSFGSFIELNDASSDEYASIRAGEILMTAVDASIQITSSYFGLSNNSAKPYIELGGSDGVLSGAVTIKTDLLDDTHEQQLPNKSGTFAMLDDVPTTTSQLTNDGADGVNPFITALDIPTTGQASTLVREVKNMTGATLTKGTVVYISGANGNKALVSKAIATTDALSARTFGLLQSNISNNGLGNCVIIGDLSGVNTSAFAEGAQLYLSGVTAGAFTDTRVLAPTHLVYVGKVTRSHPTQGQIEVQIQNGYELAEIHDVQIVTPLNNQTILFETSSQLWKNKTIIEDSIANGVTNVAPSQNAVFDALALKQNDLATFQRKEGITFFDDFLGTNDNAGISTSTGVTMSAVGTGSAARITGVYPNRTNQQGVIQLATGTTASGGGSFRLGSGNTPTFFVGSGAISYEVLINIETLSTLANRFVNVFGFYTGSSITTSNNLISFIYDEGGVFASGGIGASPNWKCVTGNGGTRTSTDSTIAVTASAWTKLRIEINANATSVGFYINDTLVATHTTNIPATTTALYFLNGIQKTTGLTSINIYGDYFSLKQNFTTAR